VKRVAGAGLATEEGTTMFDEYAVLRARAAEMTELTRSTTRQRRHGGVRRAATGGRAAAKPGEAK